MTRKHTDVPGSATKHNADTASDILSTWLIKQRLQHQAAL